MVIVKIINFCIQWLTGSVVQSALQHSEEEYMYKDRLQMQYKTKHSNEQHI